MSLPNFRLFRYIKLQKKFLLTVIVRYFPMTRFLSIIILVKFFFASLPLFAQTKTIDSLELLLKKHSEEDTTKVGLLLQIATAQLHKNHPKSLEYTQQALYLSKQLGSMLKTAQVYKMLGLLYRQKNDFALCKENYEKAIVLYKKLGNELQAANIYVSLGMIHRRRANYTEALRHLFKGMEVFEATDNLHGKARIYNSIAITYGELGIFDKALDYNFRSLNIHKKSNNKEEYALVLGDIAYEYYKKNEFDLALKYSKISESTSREFKKKIAGLWAIGVQGLVYEKQKKYNKAIRILEKVTSGFEQMRADYLALFFKTYLGYALVSAQEYKRAETLLTATLTSARKRKSGEMWVMSLLGLYNIHKLQNQTNAAFYFQGRYIHVRDSIYSYHKNQEFASMQLSFQMDRERANNQQKLAKKQAEIYSQNLVLKQRNTLLYTSVIIALLLVVIVLYIFRSRQKQVKFNQTLAQQNKEITEKKEEIAQQAEELRITNERLVMLDEFKQRMTGMIVHDLKNPLNAIIGLSEKKYSPQFQKNINQSGIRMLNLVMNILDVQRFEEAEILLTQKPHSLKLIIQKAHEQVSLSLAEKGVLFRQDVPENLVVNIDESLVVRVFVNLFNNAIKYTPAKGKITVTLEDISATMQKILVNDTGVGIPSEFIDSAFDKFSRHNNPEESGHSSGLGLTFCKQAVEAHEGEIGIISKITIGSTFWFTLPKASLGSVSVTTRKGLIAAVPEMPCDSFATLSSKEKDILYPYIQQLQKMEIYELTAIKNILGQLPGGNSAIQKWKKELENTLYSWNEVKFKELLHDR